MSKHTTKQIVLKSKPLGRGVEESDFEFKNVDLPDHSNGLLVKTLFLSVDPYMRPKLTLEKSYTEPYKEGKPMYGGGVGQVLDSRVDGISAGDTILCDTYPWQETAVFTREQVEKGGVRKIDPKGLSPSYFLGSLGMPGQTAHIGLFEVAKAKPGETVVISSAAGAVGTVAGQLAKLHGCKVVGIVGSEDKAKAIRELGYDYTINYKQDNIHEELKRLGTGVDVYFDNVGGATLDAVLSNLNNGARIASCGALSQYNAYGEANVDKDKAEGVYNLFNLVAFRATIQGFLVYDFQNKFEAIDSELQKLVAANKLKPVENVVKGFENVPKALVGLFKGDNVGKQVVAV